MHHFSAAINICVDSVRVVSRGTIGVLQVWANLECLGTVSARIPASFLNQVPLGEFDGQDRRRRDEDGERQRGQIR